MDISKFYEEGHNEPSLFRCGKCGLIYSNEEAAEKCCKPLICSVCGREICQEKGKKEAYYINPLRCRDCYEKDRIAKQEVWTQEHWEEMNKQQDWKYGYIYVNDTFYDGIDEAVSDLACIGLSFEEIKDSLFYVCETLPVPKLDMDQALENAEERMCLEDYDSDRIWKDLDELRTFMDNWNAKQDFDYYKATNIRIQPNDELIQECLKEYEED